MSRSLDFPIDAVSGRTCVMVVSGSADRAGAPDGGSGAAVMDGGEIAKVATGADSEWMGYDVGRALAAEPPRSGATRRDQRVGGARL